MSASEFRRICVFCASSDQVAPVYFEAARRVGRWLAEREIAVVYGGGRVGLMGALANAALEAGGQVLGVIPDRLMQLELGHTGVSELFVVDSMHARKMLMASLSDAFIALPGGWGTLEEVFEVTTWTQLGYHRKPVGLLNVNGYYDGLLQFLDQAAQQAFIRAGQRQLLQAATDLEELLEGLARQELPASPTWIERP